jgi:hypothetical protein
LLYICTYLHVEAFRMSFIKCFYIQTWMLWWENHVEIVLENFVVRWKLLRENPWRDLEELPKFVIGLMEFLWNCFEDEIWRVEIPMRIRICCRKVFLELFVELCWRIQWRYETNLSLFYGNYWYASSHDKHDVYPNASSLLKVKSKPHVFVVTIFLTKIKCTVKSLYETAKLMKPLTTSIAYWLNNHC